MLPTLLPSDRVLVDKPLAGARIYRDFHFDKEGIELKNWRTRGRRSIRRNDVAVFNYPEHGGRIPLDHTQHGTPLRAPGCYSVMTREKHYDVSPVSDSNKA